MAVAGAVGQDGEGNVGSKDPGLAEGRQQGQREGWSGKGFVEAGGRPWELDGCTGKAGGDKSVDCKISGQGFRNNFCM